MPTASKLTANTVPGLSRLMSTALASAASSCTLAVTLLLLVSAAPALAQTETVLYDFTGQADGSYPNSGPVLDKKVNLYGTVLNGGASHAGSVFKLTRSGVFTVLYSFTGQSDGGYPAATPILDTKGNLYGTTTGGGAFFGGTVFQVAPSGMETVLHSFSCSSDGCTPVAALVRDKRGNFYGTTDGGGTYGHGTVFELTPTGTFTVLYNFTGGSDGGPAVGGVAFDKHGNLYGATQNGGVSGYGTVFKLTPSGTETVLHSFTPNGADGFNPNTGVELDSSGNLYGTTAFGGSIGVGTIFQVTPSGTETVLHNFTGGADGISPSGSLILDKTGVLYGTTFYGGSFDLGIVFELSPSGVETFLHSFAPNSIDGVNPNAGVVRDRAGNLYGTTYKGGTTSACQGGCGTVFKIGP